MNGLRSPSATVFEINICLRVSRGTRLTVFHGMSTRTSRDADELGPRQTSSRWTGPRLGVTPKRRLAQKNAEKEEGKKDERAGRNEARRFRSQTAKATSRATFSAVLKMVEAVSRIPRSRRSYCLTLNLRATRKLQVVTQVKVPKFRPPLKGQFGLDRQRTLEASLVFFFSFSCRLLCTELPH